MNNRLKKLDDLGGKGSGAKKHLKNIKASSRSDYKGYQQEYYQKRTKPLKLESYLAGAKAIAPPKKPKGQEWSF